MPSEQPETEGMDAPSSGFRYTPREVRDMIEEDLTERRRWTDRSRKLLRQYHAFDQDYPLNHCFEWCANIVGQLFYSNPTVKVTEAGFANQETMDIQEAMRNLINRPDWRFSKVMRSIAYDVQFDFGVMYVYGEPFPDFEGPAPVTPHWPVLRRISPRMYGRDCRAPELGGQPRHEWHVSVRHRLELQNARDAEGQPLYDMQAVEALTRDAGIQEIQSELERDGITLSGDPEDWVVIYEVYVHPTKAGDPGAWVSLGWNGDEERFLRVVPQRRASLCPSGGPYTLFGTWEGVDQVYPTPNLAVTKELVDDINTHRRKIRDDAASAKRIVIVNGASTGEVASLKSAQSNSILTIAGFNGMLSQVDIGGPDKESFAYAEFATAKLDRLSGLSEVARGEIDSSATATAVAQAGAFTDVRLKHAQNVFIGDTVEGLSKVADLLLHCDLMMFPVTVRDEQTGETRREEFYGGQMGMPEMNWPWRRRIVCEVEPNSMSYRNETQYREALSEAFAKALEIINASAANPSIRPGPMLDDLFESLNIPEASRRYFDVDMLNAMIELAKMQMGMQASMLIGGMMPPGGGGIPGGRGGSSGMPAPPGLPPGKASGIVQGQAVPAG